MAAADLELRMQLAEHAIVELQASSKHLEADVLEIKETLNKNHTDLQASVRDLATSALNAAPDWAVRQIGWTKWIVGLLMGVLACETTALLWTVFSNARR